jgi:hypothetical protein
MSPKQARLPSISVNAQIGVMFEIARPQRGMTKGQLAGQILCKWGLQRALGNFSKPSNSRNGTMFAFF